MKKSSVLLLLPLLLLASCQEEVVVPKSFEEKVQAVQGNLRMKGTLSYKFHDSETELPTDSDPVTTNLDVAFTEEGYVLSYEGEFDQDFSQTLFKSTDNTVELRYITNLNELAVERPKDDDGNEVDFTPYTNPFKLLETENLIISDNDTSATLDFTNHLDTALDFVGSLTWYGFTELKEVSITADANRVTDVHIVTPVLHEMMRAGVYTFDLTVDSLGNDVTGPVTPEPAKPNEKQEVLQTALEELAARDYEASLVVESDYGTYRFGVYKNSTGVLCSDMDEPLYSMGFVKDNEQLYEISYNDSTSSYEKRKTDMPEEEYIQPWLMFSSPLYEPSEDGKQFTLSSKVDSSYTQVFATILSVYDCMEMAGATGFTITLDENNHVSTVSFVSDYGLFSSAVFTITNLGSCTMPFNVSELTEIE